MSKRENGGSAFPRSWPSDDPDDDPDEDGNRRRGMTLLDYFAAKALGGLIASFGKEDAEDPRWKGRAPELRAARFAQDAYLVADAMLKERSRVRVQTQAAK